MKNEQLKAFHIEKSGNNRIVYRPITTRKMLNREPFPSLHV